MIYTLKCNKCGTEYQRRGENDPETNAYEITDKEGDFCPSCGSDDWDCVHYEYPERLDDDVL